MYDLLSGVLPSFDLRWNFVLRCTEVGLAGQAPHSATRPPALAEILC